jgi:hypothetical protein
MRLSTVVLRPRAPRPGRVPALVVRGSLVRSALLSVALELAVAILGFFVYWGV